MRTKIVEATNGPQNWGKFMLAEFEEAEWEYRSQVDGGRLLDGRGWAPGYLWVLDLQTGEGALFKPGGVATSDLNKHRIWVCPLFEPFLTWLYEQPDPFEIPTHVDLADAPFAFRGYRRAGPRQEGPTGE